MAKSIKLGSDTYLSMTGTDGWVKAQFPNDANANNYNTTHLQGWYYVGDNSSMSNVPASWGFLLVMVWGTVCHQFFSQSGNLYQRSYSNSSWSAWRRTKFFDTFGYTYIDSGTVSVATGTVVRVKQVILPAGTYIISASIIYPAGTAGTGNYRRCAIVWTTNTNLLADSQCPPCTGATTRVSATGVIVLNGETIYLLAEQNSGGALSVTYILRAVRVA